MSKVILGRLGLGTSKPDLTAWRKIVALATKQYDRVVKVGVVAKYLDNADTYICVFEALKTAGWANNVGVEICWIDAVKLETMSDDEVTEDLCWG